MVDHADGLERCAWCGTDPDYVAYHDSEWGIPAFDERHLFEMLILEGQQAGLSWLTILKKRTHFRAALAEFDPERIARFNERDIERLLGNAGIVRNRAKLEAAVTNARAFIELGEREGSFSDWLWAFVDGRPIVNRPTSVAELPAYTSRSQALSKALKGYGFRFVGPTICHAYMQAAGLIDDHVASCFRARADR